MASMSLAAGLPEIPHKSSENHDAVPKSQTVAIRPPLDPLSEINLDKGILQRTKQTPAIYDKELRCGVILSDLEFGEKGVEDSNSMYDQRSGEVERHKNLDRKERFLERGEWTDQSKPDLQKDGSKRIVPLISCDRSLHRQQKGDRSLEENREPMDRESPERLPFYQQQLPLPSSNPEEKCWNSELDYDQKAPSEKGCGKGTGDRGGEAPGPSTRIKVYVEIHPKVGQKREIQETDYDELKGYLEIENEKENRTNTETEISDKRRFVESIKSQLLPTPPPIKLRIAQYSDPLTQLSSSLHAH